MINLTRRLRALALAIALAPTPGMLFSAEKARGEARQQVEVVPIPLSMSNVYLVKGTRGPILVDSGSTDDLAQLTKNLARAGLRIEDLATVILTHGHADHAGLAAEIRRRSGAVIIAGRGDRAMLDAGLNSPVTATGFTGRLILLLPLDPRFAPLRADVEVDGTLELAAYGLPGRAVQMPGHTPGSLVILLDDGRAFVGDMILGGWLGGALLPHRAGEHYFHMDVAGNRANIAALAKQAIRTYFLGHGGPVSGAAVRESFSLDDAAR
ncbi:MAG: Metallo-beta-lactamase L1 precursor [Candidatus Accumulibacter appositus]|uniref:Metallo-beta-lactamase L1 n=1 Tax=Candidatus Accumulibacter appositus TaxID=1454003 RepID=A0A011QPR7_9PROT|nr:MBL fold metallo-hydrolase [Accumulibacter sp.]EXI80869.1 MAG: Metallo-beta-lactamase L1 precursor [Candidatus Accumulibacter appositus]HRF03874.1 MBL fold metallo-hydrolase [Accumulibacter sp.]